MIMRIPKPSATKDAHAEPFTTTVTVSRLRRKLGDPPISTTTPGADYRIARVLTSSALPTPAGHRRAPNRVISAAVPWRMVTFFRLWGILALRG
jgi:hypothetical protein